MAKKQQQSSGSSYSLLALLKRTLFLHETSTTDELVEEVHEYMLKDQSYEQIKMRFVDPILHHNPSFLEIEDEPEIWKLSEGNKVNDAVYEMFLKHKTPLSGRQVLNRLAKSEHLDKLNIDLDLKNDARFSDLDGGKYWILSGWVVINDYARSILLRTKAGLTEKELLQRVVDEYGVDKDRAVFIPMLDDRFVKKERKWILKRYTEQKAKLRASKIERLYQYLLKAGTTLTSDELTSTVLHMPANSTDVDEKLAEDPRFVFEKGKWDLQTRVEEQQAALATPAPELIQEEPSALDAPAPIAEDQEEIESVEEPPIASEEPAVSPEIEEVEPVAEDIGEEEPQEMPEEKPVLPEVEEQVIPEEELAAEVQEPDEEEPSETQMDEEEPSETQMDEEEPSETQMDEYLDKLRTKVIEFLQDAFHAEGVVYNADIINKFVNSDEREELFEQFVRNHFFNESKGRILTERYIIKFMVYLAEATLNDKIIDPCCGSGGFLLQILETLDAHLQEAEWTERDFSIHYELRTGQFYFVNMSEEERGYFELPLEDEVARWLPIIRFCKQQRLTGVDYDGFAYRTADLNLAIAGFPAIVLHKDNALASKQIGSGVYDLVIGNPPATSDNPTRFLRRSVVLAKPGGKILLLLPDEMFSDFRLVSGALRNQITSQTVVRAVIRLPEPADPHLYGPRRTLLYCFRKHRETEQQSGVFAGQINDFNGLQELMKVIEYPDEPVSQSDNPISGDVINYVLSSYQGTAYNLFIEGLRRQILQGHLLTLEDWGHLKSD